MEVTSPIIFTNPKLQYENTYFLMKDNTIVKITQYINDNDCIVQFQNNGYITHTTLQDLYNGNVHNPYNSPKNLSVIQGAIIIKWQRRLEQDLHHARPAGCT